MKNKTPHRLFEVMVLLLFGVSAISCADNRAQMVLTFSPENANVTVDGYRPTSLSSPYTFHFYKPGDYKLEVSAPGYIPVTMMISVAEGEVLSETVHLVKKNDAGDPPNIIAVASDSTDTGLTPTISPESIDSDENAFLLNVSSVPPGATVTAQRPGGPSEMILHTPGSQSLARNTPWYITISKGGYKPIRRTVIGTVDNNTVNLNVTLESSGINPSTPSTIAVSPPPKPPLVQPDPMPVPRDSSGRLSVITTPQTQVSIDGKAVGDTPIQQYPLPPGKYRILMENRDLAKRKVQTIQIHSGEHVRIHQEL